jgi:hypothetical protein
LKAENVNKLSQFDIDLFEKCFKKWGVESQIIILMEECAEVIQSCSKDLLRNTEKRTLKERFDHFAEEIADARLMMDEIAWQYNLEPDIEYFRSIKTQRLEKLLEK